MAGYDINLLKGTPLYDLARNANVYGGKTLSKTEMVFFQQQCREMGFDPAKYGLEVETEDLEGADFKETQKSQKNLANAIDQAYQGQFGKKNNAVQVAKDAETRAYSIINTAKEAFTRNHGETKFAPESLGLRPNFMAPEYKGNLTKYVSDLNAWGQKVAEQYRNADAMTNEELAQLIMANDDKNAAMNAGVTVGVGEAVMKNDDINTALLSKQLEEGKAEILEQIKDSEGNIRQAIKTTEGRIVGVIRNAQGKIIKAIGFAEGRVHDHLKASEGRLHEHMDKAELKIHRHMDDIDFRSEWRDMLTNMHIAQAEQNIKNNTHEEADRTIRTLDPTGLRRGASDIRDRFTR